MNLGKSNYRLEKEAEHRTFVWGLVALGLLLVLSGITWI